MVTATPTSNWSPHTTISDTSITNTDTDTDVHNLSKDFVNYFNSYIDGILIVELITSIK